MIWYYTILYSIKLYYTILYSTKLYIVYDTVLYCGASFVAQLVKNPPAVQEIWIRSLGWEDPLEKRKATYSSIPAWRIPWTV